MATTPRRRDGVREAGEEARQEVRDMLEATARCLADDLDRCLTSYLSVSGGALVPPANDEPDRIDLHPDAAADKRSQAVQANSKWRAAGLSGDRPTPESMATTEVSTQVLKDRIAPAQASKESERGMRRSAEYPRRISTGFDTDSGP
jgi:hypothetical protein